MFLKLAWRNLWRNQRRTLISISSVAFAVLFASVMMSFQKGTWDHLIDNIVRSYLGYAQIHQLGYWNDQTLENSFDPEAVPVSVKDGIDLTPRLESFALASSGEITRGAMVTGIDPETENRMSGLKNRLTAGNYFEPNDRSALVGEGLAGLLKLNPGDTIILLSQGYQGQNAVGAYPVKGLVKFGSPNLNKQMVYLPLPVAREFYGTGERLTTLVVNLPGRDALPATLVFIQKELPDDEFEVLNYEELMPDLIETRELKMGGTRLILMILYMIIAFGMFGTILMMTRERTYEFGVMTAVGTKRKTLAGMLWSESLLIGLIGSVAGIIISLPIVWYLHAYPIPLTGNAAAAFDQFGIEAVVQSAFEIGIFLEQALVIFLISSVVSLYSLWYILWLKPMKAMRG